MEKIQKGKLLNLSRWNKINERVNSRCQILPVQSMATQSLEQLYLFSLCFDPFVLATHRRSISHPYLSLLIYFHLNAFTNLSNISKISMYISANSNQDFHRGDYKHRTMYQEFHISIVRLCRSFKFIETNKFLNICASMLLRGILTTSHARRNSCVTKQLSAFESSPRCNPLHHV